MLLTDDRTNKLDYVHKNTKYFYMNTRSNYNWLTKSLKTPPCVRDAFFLCERSLRLANLILCNFKIIRKVQIEICLYTTVCSSFEWYYHPFLFCEVMRTYNNILFVLICIDLRTKVIKTTTNAPNKRDKRLYSSLTLNENC